MKLDRNINPNGSGKYALFLVRRFFQLSPIKMSAAFQHMEALEKMGLIDGGGSQDRDFFVIRLKDKYAEPALRAYAEAAREDDPEWAHEVDVLADMAARHPNKHRPD